MYQIENDLLGDAPSYDAAKFPEPRAFQVSAHEALRQGAREGHRAQLLMAPTGAGKCLGAGTPVLLADGRTIPVEHVRPGDRLLGPDGTGRNVLSVASGWDRLYRVTPRKGASYVVNSSHILSLRKTPGSDGLCLADGSTVARDSDVVNVNVEVFAASNGTAQHCLKGWRSDAVEFEGAKEELLLDPYWLGCWLGDGHQHMPALSSPPCKMVDEWKETAKRYGYEVVVIQQREGDCPSWRIVSRTRDGGGQTFNALTSGLDLYGLRDKKHVPHAYKTASIEDRRLLIAGMIDSDGSLSRKGFDWISKYRELAEDFAFLCRSVGLAAYVAPCIKGIRSRGFEGQYWRVGVSGDTDAIPCLDKRAEPRQQKKRVLVHGIQIEPIGDGAYYGFEIDGDHLFLLGDFTVTHNTYLGLRIAHEALVKGRRAMFLCDRVTLINQTSATADRFGLSAHGVIQAQHWRYQPSMPFQIASAQTLQRRQWASPDVLIVDEAHTQLSVWVDYIKSFEGREKEMPHIVGLSATPFSPGLGKLFTNLVNAASMHELVELGVLVPMRIFTCTRANMAGAATAGGEWTDGAAAERGLEIVGDVVTEWSKLAQGRKTIVFGATIAHCEELCRQFNESGIMAAVFCADTTPAEREAILKDYRSAHSTIRVLVSVEALAKGFDVPDVGCVVDCRPLRKSLSTFIQMIGRGLRASPETGKQDCMLLDHSGNITRFAKDFEEIYFNGLAALDSGEKLDKTIRKDEEEEKTAGKCPKCGHTPFSTRCMACGHRKERAPLIEHEAGAGMREIMVGKVKLADDRRDLYNQIATYTHGIGKPETARGRAAHIFRDIVGTFPPSYLQDSWSNVPVTKPVKNQIVARNIARAKAMKR